MKKIMAAFGIITATLLQILLFAGWLIYSLKGFFNESIR
jgi:hypothetical protein